MSWTVPSIAVFKAKFFRDFNYAPTNDPDNLGYVTDADIQGAFDNASQNFNPIYGTVAQSQSVFLWLAAFYLVFSIQNSTQGLASASNFPINSKSVGGVSIGFSIPEKYAKSAALSIYTQNGYGMIYLSLVLPYLTGNVVVINGTSTWN